MKFAKCVVLTMVVFLASPLAFGNFAAGLMMGNAHSDNLESQIKKLQEELDECRKEVETSKKL